MTDLTPLTPEQRDHVEANVGLAQHLAWDATRRNPVLDPYDALSVAYEALVRCVQRFDPTRADENEEGVKDIAGAFSGYARTRISGAILDFQRSRDHVPRRQRSTYKMLKSLGYGAGRSLPELADLTGMPEDRIRLIVAAVEAPPIPLHAEVLEGTADSTYVHERIAPSPSVESTALESRIKGAVAGAFDLLTDFQQLVIALRYYEGQDLRSISEILGTGLSRVRTEHSEALLCLHEAMVREAS